MKFINGAHYNRDRDGESGDQPVFVATATTYKISKSEMFSSKTKSRAWRVCRGAVLGVPGLHARAGAVVYAFGRFSNVPSVKICILCTFFRLTYFFCVIKLPLNSELHKNIPYKMETMLKPRKNDEVDRRRRRATVKKSVNQRKRQHRKKTRRRKKL